MDTSKEGDISAIGKKKHKKRKIIVISESGVDVNVQVAEEDIRKKKMKSKVLGDMSKDVPDLETVQDIDKCSRKEKKKKDKRQIDLNADGSDYKREVKIKKGKPGDKREPSSLSEASGERVNKESFYHEEKIVEPVKGSKQKKKKHKEPLDDSHVSATSGEDSRVGSSKRNETSFKSAKKGDANAGTAETEDINVSSITNLVGNQINNEVIKKKQKKRRKDDALITCSLDEELGGTTNVATVSDSKENKDRGSKKRKYRSLRFNNEDANVDLLENNKRNEATEPSENLISSKRSKKVKFSENVEIFPLHQPSSKGKKKKRKAGSEDKNKVDDGLIRGKRFSKEEDDIVRGAVLKYIEDHQLGDQGVEMLMKCKSHPELKDCWKEIGEALPSRPYLAVYYRAHILFERSETRKWTPEEIELVKKFYEKHGPDWRTLSDELGKHRFHVKDQWRRIRLPNRKKGNWSQEEYQKLFNLVNTDLSMKVCMEKKTKHGMLRDNICWEAICEQLSTRSNSVCCMKWYDQLVSPMVAEGMWANTDDYRLLIALTDLDASCEEDVDWDNLLEHRSGDICYKRWNQMVRHIGEYGTKSFCEQVDVLSQRYCPNILEARESYENKLPID